jgi:NTP pyrophosphatase (non-canonical NTP hydrolase)
MSEIHPVVTRIKEFADLRWPDRDLPGRMRKLGEEMGELAEAVARLHRLPLPPETDAQDDEYLDLLSCFATEVGDCAIILQDMLIISNFGGTLLDYMDAKMEVNERREWPVEEVKNVAP